VTKLPHYVLPLYPAIAILISGIVDPHLLARERWMTRGTGWWFVLPVILGVAGIAVAMILGRQLGLLAWPFAVAAMIMGLRAWRLYAADGAERSLLRGMVASILVSVTIFGVLMPSIPALFPSVALARAVRNANCPNPVAAAVGYHEPSLVFLAGTKTFLAEGFQAADFLRQGGCRFALIEQRQERGFLRRADAIGLRYKLETTVEGINISIGRMVSIAVYRAELSP
jgi:4-amino-4-deoxy-L-arabinose transferase-like glycosyltransferase